MSHTKKPTIEKIILPLLGLLALAALVRTMFLGLEIDEEYALSLGFRLVRGDRLFYSMWEPHQLAALPPALLIGLFTAVAGTTTGVLLFVRGAVLAVKLALAVWFYRSLRVALGGRCAYLLALAVLAFTPKWFLGPDYVSQQFHFTLAAFLFLYGYYAPGPRQYRGLWRVAAGGVCACLSFLAYPQTLAAAPVLMLALLLLGRGSADKCRGLWVFVLTCAVCGGAFVVYVLQGMGFDFAALLARADLILHDPQYDFTTADRLAMLRSQLSAVIGNCWLSALAGVALAAAGMLFGERRGFARSLEKALWYTAFFLSLWCTAYCLRAQELDFVYVELMKGLQKGFVPKRCANCGRWFLQMPGMTYAYCGEPAPGQDGKTCREIGATSSFRSKVQNNDVWKAHQRAYKKYFARTRKGTMSKGVFEMWSRKMETLRDDALKKYDRAQSEEERQRIVDEVTQKLNKL